MLAIQQIPTRTLDQLGEIAVLDGDDLITVQRGVGPAQVARTSAVTDYIAANIAEIRGAKGDPGANVMAVGLFSTLGDIAIPGGTDVIRTSGWDIRRQGAGHYERLYEADFTEGAWAALAENRYLKQDAAGAWWRLKETFVTSAMLGATGDFDDAADTGADNQEALQQMLDVVAINGGVCQVLAGPEGGGFLLLSQLRIHAKTVLKLGPGVVLWRGWKTVGSNKGYATIINANHLNMASLIVNPGPYDWETAAKVDGAFVDHEIYIEGPGGFDVTSAIRAAVVANSHFAGPHISFFGVEHCAVRGTRSRVASREWFANFIAIDVEFSGNTVTGGTNVYEDGPHFQGGRNFRIFGNHIESGDDTYPFGSNYNLAIRDVSGSANTGSSLRGHLVRLVNNREGSTLGYPAPTSYVEDIRFSAVGPAGQLSNACLRLDTDAAAPTKIRNVWLHAQTRQGDMTGHNGANAYGVVINGGLNIHISGAVANHIRNGVRVRGNADRIFLDLEMGAGQDTAGYQVVDIDGCGMVSVSGKVVCTTRAGIIANNTGLLVLQHLTVTEIPTGYGVVRLQGTTKMHSRVGVVATKAAGATGTYGYRSEGAAIQIQREGDDLTGVDSVLAIATNPIAYSGQPAPGTTRQRTISAATVQWLGETEIQLLTGGGSVDMSTLTSLPGGIDCGLISGEAVPGTDVVTLKTGATANKLNLGADYALNTAGKGVRVRGQGGIAQKLAQW